MMLAIESLVRLIETLLIETPRRAARPQWRAANDNEDVRAEDRLRAAHR